MEGIVKIYKVCLPSYYAWPPGNVILTVTYDLESAKKYIEEYPNLFLRPWLKIEVDEQYRGETD